MPSVLHEALVDVIRERPDVLIELLARTGLLRLSAHDRVDVVNADLGSALPRELRADGVLKLSRGSEPPLAVVLEVQLSVDPEKLITWPAYLVSARSTHRCDVILVVVTADRGVAAWARKPIVLGPGSGAIQPLVLGPEEIPGITDLTEARLAPELAALSTLAHVRDEDPNLVATFAAAALTALLDVPDERGLVYYDLILATLNQSAREALDMLTRNYELKDPGLRKAWSEGKAEGKAEGEAEGEAKGKAEGVLAVLEARGIAVGDAERSRVLSCTDVAQLDRWLRAAVTAASAAEVLASR